MTTIMLMHSRAPVVRVNKNYVQMLLAAHGVSTTEIARIAGVHRWTVSRVLHNFRKVDPHKRMAVIRAIATKCGRDPEEIVAGRLAA